MAHQNKGPITILQNENQSSRNPKTLFLSSLNNSNRASTTRTITKRIWIGVGWYYYQSRVRSDRLSLHEGASPQDDEIEIERS